MYHLETHCVVFESRLWIIGSCYQHLSITYMNRLLLFVGNFIHVYNVSRSCILPITLQFNPVLLHFPFCVKPTKSISAICINRSEGPSAMFISTSWPMTTLGTSAQKQHNSFHHSEVSFDMAPFPFNSPLIIWWTC